MKSMIRMIGSVAAVLLAGAAFHAAAAAPHQDAGDAVFTPDTVNCFIRQFPCQPFNNGQRFCTAVCGAGFVCDPDEGLCVSNFP